MTISVRNTFSRAAQACLLLSAVVATAYGAPLNLQPVPLYLSSVVEPNVLLNMSVEAPMGGAAYNDNVGIPAGCAGRRDNVLGDAAADNIGRCYFAAQIYLGYFDPAKCYTYSVDHFEPAGAATATHTCSSKWSGNFLNWASMTAIDMFTWNMTGGNRTTDNTTLTIVRRARKQNDNGWFPRKVVNATQNVVPGTVTPFSDTTLYIHNTDWGFNVGTTFASATGGSPNKGSFNVSVRVCATATTLEANCVPYGSPAYYKPEGLIQRNASSKRFGVIAYSLDNTPQRDGGVLRSNIKYVGPKLPDGAVNPVREFGTDGLLINNPDGATGGLNSGVINYVNKFSDAGYKNYDPISELFYESVRYFKHLAPTPEYSAGLTPTQCGGFQVLSTWSDPIQSRCQKNFIIAINDANPWLDKKLPGTFFTAATINGATGHTAEALDSGDYGEPSNPDPDINVTTLTNRVGELEGLNGVLWPSTGTWTSGTISGAKDSVGGGTGTWDNSCTAKTVANLGEVMGTCPAPYKQNSYYVAGLAYYANTTDLRTETGMGNDRGIQNVQSFVIDTQEFNANPLDGPKNMLWLAGKYGGFNDANEDGIPQASEWDADGDGSPDNYVLATQPQNLVAGLNKAFDFIDRQISSASSASVNSGSISGDTRVYQAKFNSGDWTGQLLAYPINQTDGSLGTLDWDAATKLPAAGSRKIITRDSTGTPRAFRWASLDTTRQNQLDTNATKGQALLNYLRGDATNEGTGATSYRRRITKLGDIVSSSPLFVGRPSFRYPETLETPSYAAFATTYANRRMVFAGANDGMLHGFDARTPPTTTGGVEIFAYIPGAVFTGLPNLAAQNYAHQFFVDGAPSMGDVVFSSNWHTVLVGGLNKGGQAIYALDITDPAALANAESSPSNVALWEFTDADDADLGLTYSQPAIVRLHDGTWAAVFGNGYNNTIADAHQSTTGNAALYIVNIATGALIKKFDTKTGTAQAPTGVTWDNGMSTPALVDLDGDRTVDYAYAGDLYGNMWKFDLTGATSASWHIAYGTAAAPVPFYTARDASGVAQPITVRPEVARGPMGAGMIVLFGTGKYLEPSDKTVGTPQRPQSFYGVIDRNSGTDTDLVADRDSLTQQEILAEMAVDVEADPDGAGPLTAQSIRIRATTDNALGANSGWYIDLVSPAGYQAEKQVTNPIVRNGNVVFTTLIPDADPCNFGGNSWLMELSLLDGSRLRNSTPFDINRDGQFTPDDYVPVLLPDGTTVSMPISGVGSTEGILSPPGVVDGEMGPIGQGRPVQYKYLPGTSGNIMRVTENPGANGTGRQSWRQIR
jgi:type IV pilus assembly protein PilY1